MQPFTHWQDAEAWCEKHATADCSILLSEPWNEIEPTIMEWSEVEESLYFRNFEEL